MPIVQSGPRDLMLSFPNMTYCALGSTSLVAKASRVTIHSTITSEAFTKIFPRHRQVSMAGCVSASSAISSPKSVTARMSPTPEAGSFTISTAISIESMALKGFYCLEGRSSWGSTSICNLRVKRTANVDRASIGNILRWEMCWTS